MLLFAFYFSSSQTIDNVLIKEKIESFKKDAKGPYQQIMWFCPDGSKVPPQMRCPEPGGVQRATYKPWINELAQKNGIYLGQILSATEPVEFLDAKNQFSRLKQYQLENYLENIDNGWILQKAKFYRGAFQDEDENAWGENFLKWVINNKELEQNHFFLLRQAFKAIPHKSDNNNIRMVRSLSMEIAQTNPSFMNIRVKIHGQPEAADIHAVKDFRKKNETQLSAANKEKIDQLIAEMQIMFQPVNWQSVESFIKPVGVNTAAGKLIQKNLSELNAAPNSARKIEIAAFLLLDIRKIIPSESPKSKLVLFDLSNKVEELIFKEVANWQVTTLNEILQKNYVLSAAAAGAGYIELWEWEKIEANLNPAKSNTATLGQLNEWMTIARGIVEWSTGTFRANYGNEIKLFEGFEPMISGFPDDLIRSSVLLHLGKSVGDLGGFIGKYSGLTNQVFSLENQSHFRGLNPGFAKGILVLVDSPEGLEVASDKIYIFQQAPADLKPVAGIATVSEGNLVSHVQLLARNLGIPNAVLSQQNLVSLKKYEGKEIFYAVSEKGTVLMKLAEKMSAEEKALFETKKRGEQKIRVEVDKMNLNQKTVLNLREVNAKSSGKICGPKAANLGQLKFMFPNNVVEGLVIPFGIFRQHMEQKMPGNNQTYWQFLKATFQEAAKMEKEASDKTAIDNFVLGKLEILRNTILKMPLLPEFESDFKKQFEQVFGKEMGNLPVFLRSDTNMEDLKDFTGAGLNLTLFNVADKEKIMQGIKQVWASPYSERSFRWRQSYLLNPENVYPSILVIPTVNVDYSGVLITKGVGSGTNDDLTIAFSRGAGGAVDGQAAESYLLKATGVNKLLAPSRESYFNELPISGGTGKLSATFEKPILNEQNLTQIRVFSKNLKQKMNETNGMQGPFDVECGFMENKLWLFQVRPFVENKNAAGAVYLESITPKIDETKTISLSEKL
jgi:hypothetical protein